MELCFCLGKLETEGRQALNKVVTAKFIAKSYRKNSIFDLTHPWNRDNCFYPYYLLREKFKSHNIEINTSDIEGNGSRAFDLHMDIQNSTVSAPSYLLMLETPQVYPENGISENWNRYCKVFTWRDDLVDGKRFIKLNFPNPLIVPEIDGWSRRDRFCCLISGNRTLAAQDEKILYPERVKTIRWFEQNAAQEFDLYGIDWDIPVVPSGLRGKLLRRLWRNLTHFIKLRPFPSYRGKVEHKREVLQHTRFSICYENVRDLPGYITEKIFDSFFSGCVPVYWGASNITDYIPVDCFIDRRNFIDTEAVYNHLKTIKEEEFYGYQQRIAKFLASDAAKLFGSEAFVETIVRTIVNDLDS